MNKPTKQPVIKLSDSQFGELCFVLERSITSGFFNIASALAESLRPIVADADADGDPLLPSKNKLRIGKQRR